MAKIIILYGETTILPRKTTHNHGVFAATSTYTISDGYEVLRFLVYFVHLQFSALFPYASPCVVLYNPSYSSFNLSQFFARPLFLSPRLRPCSIGEAFLLLIRITELLSPATPLSLDRLFYDRTNATYVARPRLVLSSDRCA